jgi:AcrR family transcriptional regulator
MPKISAEARQERQEAILQATVDCLNQFGYQGTSMRTIAEAAGLTKGGLYAYFDSMEAILLEVARRYMDTQLDAFDPLPGETAAEQLERILAHYEAGAEDAQMARRQRAILDLWSFAAANPAVREALEARYQRYRESLAAVIRRGQGEGAFRHDADPAQVAGLILATRDGMVLQAVKWGLPTPAGALSGLLRHMVTGWLATPRP